MDHATDFVFCGAYSCEEDDLSNSKGHRNTQPNLGERLTNISSEIKVKKKGWMRQKQQQQLIEDSKNSKTKNLIKRHRKIWPKDYLNLDSKGKKKVSK